MPEQFFLPDLEPPAPTKSGNVFFALLPEPATQVELGRLGEQARRKHGLTGRLRPLGRLHVSLWGLGKQHEVTARLAERASVAAERAAAENAPFDVEFDRIAAFNGGRSYAIMLRAEGGNRALQEFWRRLGCCLLGPRAEQLDRLRFDPHVTLVYDERRFEEYSATPVRWPVTEFVLVHGALNAARYEILGRWRFVNWRQRGGPANRTSAEFGNVTFALSSNGTERASVRRRGTRRRARPRRGGRDARSTRARRRTSRRSRR